MPIAILFTRVVARRTGACELLLILMAAITTACTHWFPTFCNLRSVWLLTLSASAFLLKGQHLTESPMEALSGLPIPQPLGISR